MVWGIDQRVILQISNRVAGPGTGTSAAADWNIANSAPISPNNATRILLPTAPSGVAQTNIYRSNDSTANRWFLAAVAANVTFYDDWQSQSDFAGTLGPLAQAFNTTAGGIIDSGGNEVAYFNAQGIQLPGSNARFKFGTGWQFYNTTTGLWHTLLCTGNPPQLAVDAGTN